LKRHSDGDITESTIQPRKKSASMLLEYVVSGVVDWW
jgi:hypothetical protein